MYFVWCALIIVGAILPGVGILAWLPATGRARLGEWWLWLAPAVGLSVVAASGYPIVLAANALTWYSALPGIALALCGIFALWQRRLSVTELGISRWVAGAGTVLLVAGLPLRNHLAPPDVDPQLFGVVAAQLKRSASGDIGFPLTRLWASWPSEHLFGATAGSEMIVAGFSQLTEVDLGKSLVIVATVWVTVALLAAAVIANALLGSRSRWLMLAAFPLVFNSAMVWEYGDGSYARAAALAPTIAVAALLSQGHTGLGRGGLAIVGVMHGATAYLLYRVFLWNTMALVIWGGLVTFRSREAWKATLTDLLHLPLSAVVVVLPIAISVWSRWSVYASVHLEGTPLFASKHSLTFAQLFAYGEYTHSYAMGGVALLGFCYGLVPMLQRQSPGWTDAFLSGVAFTASMLFFSADRLVMAVLPFTANLLYSQMAIISNWSVTKLVGGLVSFCAVADVLTPRRYRVRAVAWFTLAGVWGWLGQSVWAEGTARWPAFIRLLPDTSGVEFVYAWLAWLVAAAGLSVAPVFARRPAFVTLLILSAAATLMAADIRVGRFNYPYLSSDEVDAYGWLRDNTNSSTTMVLTPASLELPQDVRAANAARYFGGGEVPLIYPLGWLPVISERSSIFSRAVFTSTLSGVHMTVSGSSPDLERLDWAFWNLDTEEAEALLRRHGITHVYLPAFYARLMKPQLDVIPYLSLVHESVLSDGFKFPNLVYAVDPSVL